MNIEHLHQIDRQHKELWEDGCGHDGCGGPAGVCAQCEQRWPCETRRLLVEITRLKNELRVAQSETERLRIEVER